MLLAFKAPSLPCADSEASLKGLGVNQCPLIEDGIAYLASSALSENSTLFAVDLTSTGIVLRDMGANGFLAGVENGIVYFVHNVEHNLVAANMADQLHQFFL